MSDQYVIKLENGAYRVAGTRISLDSVVYAFWRGACREHCEQLPDLTLEQVFGAIAYYLANQSEIDAYLKEGDAEFEKLRQQLMRTRCYTGS